jgi:hypothetical protein
MKRHLPFIIASLLCLPFVAAVLAYLAMLALGGLSLHCPDFIGKPVIYSFFWLTAWPVVVVPVLATVSASVVGAWLQKSKTGFECFGIAIYTVVMLLHIGFVILWHVTGRVWEL